MAGQGRLVSAAQDAFSRSYAEARQKFLQAADRAGLAVEGKPHPLAGLHGEPLAMDVARDGPPDASKLLIVSSACHGAEGYCGSGSPCSPASGCGWDSTASPARSAACRNFWRASA